MPLDDSKQTRARVPAVLGVDIGTSSSKAVLVGLDGRILGTEVAEHDVSRPHPGWVEMDGELWWHEFVRLAGKLTASSDAEIVAIGVSGMGPCVLLTDADAHPVRPAILYGVDTRATSQIDAMNRTYGADRIAAACGSALSSQAAGPKIAWVADNDPDAFARARRLFMPSSFLAHKLTGAYVLDHHSASQSTPMYDTDSLTWLQPWASEIAGPVELPELVWPGDVAGVVTAAAAAETGLHAGIPVIAGTIDAWSEAVSVDGQNPGDLLLMYGTTMFLVHTLQSKITAPTLWGTVGAFKGTRNLAGGMATSGAITSWLNELFGSPGYASLLADAESSGPGARGLLMLPYFAGERTPIQDPDARGVIAGLTLSHGRGDVYRAALEATAFGVRHNIETMEQAGAGIERIVAAGGGTQGGIWTQIVSDVTGRPQLIREKTIGASFGAAFLAARTQADVVMDDWNPISHVQEPEPAAVRVYDGLYDAYRRLYPATADIMHELAGFPERTDRPSPRNRSTQ
ncbi:FGGY-family carbohydrate kinase [Spelaeicoccus albus]|uniref:Xylulokinase n=1 Tax=Spelaeicoccus albus TaxID=1280376 RepID=A0A7Z0D5W9_9MICO|nr:FGGY family carbohydrate kinase [Spelaeicoccus albus]NYI69414.1 xylulokinase [Spelaeicoccus albus]